MSYTFKYKRNGLYFWKTIKNVTGHNYSKENDKMIIYTIDSIQEIAEWSKCEVKLGADFILAQKEVMSRQAGQDVR